MGGLPPRVGVAVEVNDPTGWQLRLGLEDVVRRAPAPHALARRQKADRIRRALASGAALAAVLRPDDQELRLRAAAADADDPRLAWLIAAAPRWKEAGEKTLVFVAHEETLEMLRAALSHRGQLASGVFHEVLTPARRDIEVARFRRPEGPSLLVSTECGGEGRNFEFCHRLVLFDLPWNPVVLEQRIGRLDRIGRRIPVEIAYFRPPGGIGADVVRLYEALGLFREPLAGLEPQLAHVEGTLEATALDPAASLTGARFDALVNEAQEARTRVREAAYQQLHRDPYRPALRESILARVPPDLDGLNEAVVVGACQQLGFHVERQRGRRTVSIEFGNEAVVDSLPGVPPGSSFLGTFDREEAVEDETLDFFASGHPLVEGLLANLEESRRGRVAVLQVERGEEKGFGLLAVYKDGPSFDVVVVDGAGQPRPAWAAPFARHPQRTQWLGPERLRELVHAPDWPATVRRLGAFLDPTRQPVAVAALFVGP
jgi:ATP-dependent helicase HepA